MGIETRSYLFLYSRYSGSSRLSEKWYGKEIMNILVEYLNRNAPDKAFVGLFASQGKESFYEKYDFKDYSPNMTGMSTVIRKN